MAPTDRFSDFEEIDSALAHWAQGDCALGDYWFVFQIDSDRPLTEDALPAAQEGASLAEAAVKGLVVLTQTCDIVRSSKTRAFLEVCPLCEVELGELELIRRMKMPQYAYIEGVANLRLVADLDRVMTVEKSVVAGWIRVQGLLSDNQRTVFGEALGRKRSRFAFPDDFTSLVSKLRDRILGKHDKQSPEGAALRALREIRVQPSPSFDADEIRLTFRFIQHEDNPSDFSAHLEAWENLIPAKGRYLKPYICLTTLEDMTAKDYVESFLLDLSHLSIRSH